METRINVKLEFNSLVIGLNEIEVLDKLLNKVGPLVDRLTRELENEEQEQFSDLEKIDVARNLTRIAENMQALTKLIGLVTLSNNDSAKALFMNDTLPRVLDAWENHINEIQTLSDKLVSLDE